MDNLPCPGKKRVGALVEHDGKDLPAFFRLLVHAAHTADGYAGGLFDQHMLAGPKRIHGGDGVYLVGSGDDHRFRQAGGEHFLMGGENGNARSLAAQEFTLLRVNVAQGRDGQAALGVLQHPAQMRAADVSDSDQADSNGWCCHGKTPLFPVILFCVIVSEIAFRQPRILLFSSLFR